MPQYQGVWTLPVAARLQSTQQWATDPLYRNTTLLLQADNAANGAQNNTFLDSSSNNFTITRNGNTTQGTFTPYSLQPGAWGNYFDGTGDYLSVASATALNLSTGDLTVEGWIYMNALPAANAPVASKFNAASPYTGWTLGINSSGYPHIWFGTTYLITSISTVAIGVWHHLALVRSGTTVTLYVNGVSVGTATSSANLDNTGTLTIGIEAGNANGLNGYVSNSRIVKGTAVYTANFNPSTSPLTAITNTSLLTCQSNRFVDNSTNNFTISVAGGTPSVQAFSPFAPQYQYTPSVTGGSGYFDGANDWLTIANNSVLTPTGDFTIEFWAYVTDSSGVQEWYSKGYGIQLYINAAKWGVALSSSNSSSYFVNDNTPSVVINAWTHIALTRSGNNYRFFVNGVLISTTTSTSSPNTGTEVLRLGDWSVTTNYPAKGYMAAVRYVNGTAVYTASFTPPTSPPTAITNTQFLCNFTNAGIYDGTLKNNLETAGNAQVSTSVVKYGTGSMYFDGTGDYLVSNTATPDLYAFGTGNFTIEFWVRYASTTGIQVLYDGRPSGTQGAYPTIYSTGGSLRYYTNTSDQITGSTLSANVWYHIAVSRSGTSTKLFIDGTQSGSTYTDSTNYLGAAGRPSIGDGLTLGSYPFNGYIDDLRVTKGIARYTANFTPPTVALPRQ